MTTKLTFKEYLKEAKYHLPVKGGWDRKSKQTDSRLSPAERGRLAGSIHDQSLDYNEDTEEYNPYPLGSDEFEEYERAYQEVSDYIQDRFPDI